MIPAGPGLSDLSLRPMFLHGASRLDRQDVARRLHAHSPRAEQRFVVAALTAIPSALREDALFGRREAGWIEQARGGTLLLDEVDCLCPDLQERFATFLRMRGHGVRLIMASRHDPALLLRQGVLHQEIQLWISKLDSSQRLGPDRICAVCRLPGTGEARPSSLARALSRPLEDYLEVGLQNGAGDLHAWVIGEVERPLITMVLRRTSGNQIRAAAILGMNRNTLRKRIRELEISVHRGGDE